MTEQSAETLLPCPFCGGEALIESQWIGTTSSAWTVGCKHQPACKTYLTKTKLCMTKERAIENWNTRNAAPTPKTGWISVKSGLPEENGLYLVTVERLRPFRKMPIRKVAEFYKGSWSDAVMWDYEVLAWMPLPAPYEEKD